jgi:hypothetical protein
LIEIYVNIFRSQTTTPLLPCVVLKDGYDPKQEGFPTQGKRKTLENEKRKFKINTNEGTVIPENPKNIKFPHLKDLL